MVEIVSNQREGLEHLCRQFGVRRLYLFGSATGSGFDPSRSDLDFLVEFGPGIPGQYANRYFGLLEALQDLFHRRIDLVEPQTVTNPIVKRSMEENRVQLYAAA